MPKPEAPQNIESPAPTAVFEQENRLLLADTERNGYPPLDAAMLHDPLRGHWDLWPENGGQTSQGRQVIPVEEGRMARNPAGDIQKHTPVCIDFGTSSTVVALRENGSRRLLRIGISDWQEAVSPRHFENPTAVEFIDAKAFAEPWTSEPWRPHVLWTSLKCSHQAKDDISTVSTPQTLYSILGDLKTWIRNVDSHPPQDMRDQKGNTLQLTPDTAAPEERAPLTLNPLEIYAFHLGLAINNQYRSNGRIYHEYFLSFPATFGTATRERIRSAFEVGLKRSLPASLGMQAHWQETTPLVVREGAVEPVAYAAAVLGEDGLEPTDAGLAFGVFDFGGGTTDFAFGVYRAATEEEENRKGWENVLQLLDVQGEPDLGGEILLHLLTFTVVSHNKSLVLEKELPFVLPRTEKGIPTGMERIFEDSLIARTNTTRMMEYLRPLWEKGPEALDSENEGILRITLQNRSGCDMEMVEFKIARESLTTLLHDRILAGVRSFFVTCQQAFHRHNVSIGAQLHILLAGNACRSPLVKSCFEEHMQTITQQENFKENHFQLHDIRLPDENDPEGVTLKTGVALGLCNTMPGESTGICPIPELANPDKVFLYAFGKFRRSLLKPVLSRFSDPDTWVPLGLVPESQRVVVGYTDSPLALEENTDSQIRRDDAKCSEQSLDWPAEDIGHAIFVRPAGPNAVEVALDVSETCPQGIHSRIVSLTDNKS